MDINEKDLVHLARLAMEGKAADVEAIIRRIARKIGADHPSAAESLQKIIRRKADVTRGSRPVANMPVDLESRLQLAKIENDVRVSADPIWQHDVELILRQVIAERENQEELARADLHPARSLLFVGPPGVGKTLSARWFAATLEIPLITLDLAAVMSSFLGRTGNNLRNVLDYAKGSNCILLLDEFDAIAKRRDDAIEVGELKRLVTVLLQEIDHWPPTGLLIAATNHPELLDPAIWRRFDLVADFGTPTDEHVKQFVTHLLKDQSSKVSNAVAAVMHGMSFSDIEREVLGIKRRAVLSSVPLSDALEAFIVGRVSNLDKKERRAASVELMKLLGQRKAQKLTGISRDTMRKDLNSNPNVVEDDDG